jgi:large subunit ribosomal protein L15
MNLHDVNKGIKKRKKLMRVGRGPGSGQGKTAGRGNKGQGQLAGWAMHPAFEGGQMPLYRRIPKRGFNNRWALKVRTVNVGDFDESFDAGTEINPESLRQAVKGRYDVLKVLGDGEVTKKFKVSAHQFSKSAEAKIKAAGGEVIVLPGAAPVTKFEKRAKKKTGPKAKAGSKAKA